MIGTIARTGLVAFAAAAFATGGAGAGTIYDGAWSLTIVTERGACDRYNLPVRISNGHVAFPGLVKAHGRVTRKGFVRVSVSAMGKTASGSGRLSRSAGRGRWAGRSGTDRCSGSWIAYRSWPAGLNAVTRVCKMALSTAARPIIGRLVCHFARRSLVPPTIDRPDDAQPTGAQAASKGG
jgi:hypothetical protein